MLFVRKIIQKKGAVAEHTLMEQVEETDASTLISHVHQFRLNGTRCEYTTYKDITIGNGHEIIAAGYNQGAVFKVCAFYDRSTGLQESASNPLILALGFILAAAGIAFLVLAFWNLLLLLFGALFGFFGYVLLRVQSLNRKAERLIKPT